MNAFESRFAQKLVNRLQELSGEKISIICSNSVSNMEDYRHHTGYLKAVQDILELCSEVETDILGQPNQLRQ